MTTDPRQLTRLEAVINEATPCPRRLQRIIASMCFWAITSCLLQPRGIAIAAAPVERPEHNSGTGYFVKDGELYDPNGLPFRIRGVNHTHSFGFQPSNTAAIPHIARSEANAVRMVFFGQGLGITLSAAEQRARVIDYIDRDIVPIVELHDHTGGNSDTTGDAIVQAVDYWLEPARKAYLQEFEREVVLNIANEWGPNSTVWRDAYIQGVQRLRDAGVNNLIMIDAGGNFGQNPNSLKSWALDILDADPQKNVLFSQHMYGYWFTNGSPPNWAFSVQEELAAIKSLGIPLVIGEFGWEDHNEVNYDTSDAVELFEEAGVGWLAWAWYRGTDGDTLSLVKSVFGSPTYTYFDDDDLTEYGNLLINDPNFGFKAANRVSSIYWAPGDFEGDGVVGGGDFLTWQRGESPDPLAPSRLAEWQQHYAQSNELAASQTVPEAASVLLLIAGVGWLASVGCRCVRRRHWSQACEGQVVSCVRR